MRVFVADLFNAGWNDVGFTRGLLNGTEGTYAGPQAKTPALDALAADGIILLHHYAYRCAALTALESSNDHC
jgi:arylsulfatase A-like enzyme